MFFSNLEQEPLVIYPKAVQRALFWLKDNYRTLSFGEHLIEGREMYAQKMECVREDKQNVRPESHRRYLDIHFICQGEDQVGIAFARSLKSIAEPYDEKRDVEFYETVQDEQFFTMKEGDFWVVFPNEIHRSVIADVSGQKLCKIVVKISLAYLLTQEGE